MTCVLFDLRTMRSLAEQRYVTAEPEAQVLQQFAERYFSLIESGQTVTCMFETIDDHSGGICRINELTLLVCLGEKWELSDEDKKNVESLREQIVKKLENQELYELKSSFASMVDSSILKDVSLCFINSPILSDSDVSESTIHQFFTSHQGADESETQPVAIGPYRISAKQVRMNNLEAMKSTELDVFDGIVLFASQTSYSQSDLGKGINKAKSASKASVLIVPSSDQELEFARAIENEYNITLCDKTFSLFIQKIIIH